MRLSLRWGLIHLIECKVYRVFVWLQSSGWCKLDRTSSYASSLFVQWETTSYSSYFHQNPINLLFHIATSFTAYLGIMTMIRPIPALILDEVPWWLNLAVFFYFYIVFKHLSLDFFVAIMWAVALAGALIVNEALTEIFGAHPVKLLMPVGATIFFTSGFQAVTHLYIERRVHPVNMAEAFIWTPFGTVFSTLFYLFDYRAKFFKELRAPGLWAEWKAWDEYTPHPGLGYFFPVYLFTAFAIYSYLAIYWPIW